MKNIIRPKVGRKSATGHVLYWKGLLEAQLYYITDRFTDNTIVLSSEKKKRAYFPK